MYIEIGFLIFIVAILCALFYEHGKNKKQQIDNEKNIKEQKEKEGELFNYIKNQLYPRVDKFKKNWKKYKDINTDELVNSIAIYIFEHPSQLFYPHSWSEPKDIPCNDLKKILDYQYRLENKEKV